MRYSGEVSRGWKFFFLSFTGCFFSSEHRSAFDRLAGCLWCRGTPTLTRCHLCTDIVKVVISGSLPSGIVYSLFTKEETKSTNGNGVHNAATVSAVPLAYEEDARNMREGRSSVKSKRSEFESKDESSTSPDSKSQLKRKRRKAADITRDFKCAYPMCNKFYGSENALR